MIKTTRLALLLLCSALVTHAMAEDKVKQQAPKVGDVAPDFRLKGSDGKTYKLSDFKGKQAVVVAWYPKALTGGWTLECKSLRESGKVLRELKVAYFGASCDPLELNKKFADKLKLDYALLSDTDKKVAKAYGILNSRGMSGRVTFVIDIEGKIAHVFDKKDKVKVGEHGKQIATKLKELNLKPAKRNS